MYSFDIAALITIIPLKKEESSLRLASLTDIIFCSVIVQAGIFSDISVDDFEEKRINNYLSNKCFPVH